MPNEKIRIYDLARELKIPAKQLLTHLEDTEEKYTSHLSFLELRTANKLRRKLLKEDSAGRSEVSELTNKVIALEEKLEASSLAINKANSVRARLQGQLDKLNEEIVTLKTYISEGAVSLQLQEEPFALDFYEVGVRFGQAEVLKNINFQLKAEEFLAIVGPNGAGKSTLIKLALGIVKPTKGNITVFNNSVGKSFKQIGYVPQLKTFDRSFPANTLELVVSGLKHKWVARTNKSEIEKAMNTLRRVGAEKLFRRSLAELSGGELQRAFLARALVSKPQIVFLDEPATGVDFLAENDLYDLLENYQNEYLGKIKPTIVMITHDLAAARYHASKVLIVNRTIHGFGLPEEVMNETHLQKAFGHVGHYHKLTFS